MTVKTDIHALMHADLERSGLTPKDAAVLGLKPLAASETAALGKNFEALPAMQIPYWDPLRPAQPHRMFPEWPPFFRVRYLAEPNTFDRLTNKKPQRYMQPGGPGLCAYWPRSISWAPLLADSGAPLIITEGEKKAAKACAMGFPAVGLGGVWSFMSTPLSLLMLPDLAATAWARRNVYIVYDSDARTNPHVNAALWRLAEELAQRGALPHMAVLPDLHDDGRKTGLDDFLASGAALGPVLAGAEPLTLARALWDINRCAVYVRDPGLIIERAGDTRLSPGAFREHSYAAETYAERVLRADGSVSLQRTGAATVWLKWPLRAEAARLTYLPGQPKEPADEHTGAVLYNVWHGWGCAPERGTVDPFLRLIDHLFEGAPDADKAWFLRWLAYPLQHPGTKLFTAVVMYGRRHGTGKSWVGLTMGRIYGQNFSEISQADLESGFNEWAVGKQFVLGDDVTGSDRRAHADQLKKMITQKELRVNQKYVPSYVIPDCLNYYFTSNQPDAFFLDDDDRRYFVHEVEVAPLPLAFYRAYERWLEAGGAAYLFQYLLDLDLGDFEPTAPALRTTAKAAMTLDSKGDLAEWVTRLLADPDALLHVGGVPLTDDLFTNRQLLAIYDPTGRTKVTANGLGRELRRAGVQQAAHGTTVCTAAGVDRYYALRRAEQWRLADAAAVREHVDGAMQAPKKPKY